MVKKAIEREKPKSQWEKIMEYVDTHKCYLSDEDIERMKDFRKGFKMRDFS